MLIFFVFLIKAFPVDIINLIIFLHSVARYLLMYCRFVVAGGATIAVPCCAVPDRGESYSPQSSEQLSPSVRIFASETRIPSSYLARGGAAVLAGTVTLPDSTQWHVRIRTGIRLLSFEYTANYSHCKLFWSWPDSCTEQDGWIFEHLNG